MVARDEYSGRQHHLGDSINIPDAERRFPTSRNPHARSKLYYAQDKLQRLEKLADEDWAPEQTKYKIYNKPEKTESKDNSLIYRSLMSQILTSVSNIFD